jgi:hypothetical protein
MSLGLVDHKSRLVPAPETLIPECELTVSALELLRRFGDLSSFSNGDPLGRGALVGEGLPNAVSLEKGYNGTPTSRGSIWLVRRTISDMRPCKSFS